MGRSFRETGEKYETMLEEDARLTYDELLTALVEVEMVLNSRSLTVVSADDLEEPLTPSHLIIGHRLRDVPDLQCINVDPDEEFELDSDVATKRARYLDRTISQFWHRWRKEYLVGLREMHCQINKKSHAPRIAIGDVVIIHDDQPRALWKLPVSNSARESAGLEGNRGLPRSNA